MVRYLGFMSYIGSRYRGAQKQGTCIKSLDIDSIQGAIEAGLLRLIPESTIRPALTLSSRTDAGVHALCSTFHVELENKYQTIYDSESVIKWMNRYFSHCNHEIRLTSFIPIHNTFNARYAAKSRTYVYRFVYPKRKDELKLPIAEYQRAWNLGPVDFDIEKAIAATRLFMGNKNFQTFAGKNHTGKEVRYVRCLKEFKIVEGEPMTSWDPLSKNFHYWDIVCSSRSFLYNQVRRMVAGIISVGSGVLTERDINIMLHVPSPRSWISDIPIAPPHGLYLKEVIYDPEELANSRIAVCTENIPDRIGSVNE